MKTQLVPFDNRIVGSVHSHPSPDANPSKADIGMFRRIGGLHLIIAYPFESGSVRAFDSGGNKQEIKITTP